MTTFNHFRDRNRDQQDGYKRGVWGNLEYIKGAGSVLTVRGTGTVDEQAPLMNMGYGFNVPKDFNTEVMLVSLGSDTGQKYAITTLPRDMQRAWKPNTGGVQNPVDPEKALEFNPKRVHAREAAFALGDNGEVELLDGVLYIRCDVVFAKDVRIVGNVEIAGDLDCTGEVIVNGDVSTSYLRSPDGSNNNKTTSVSSNVPAFEDYDG